jgi:hypothetical protein
MQYATNLYQCLVLLRLFSFGRERSARIGWKTWMNVGLDRTLMRNGRTVKRKETQTPPTVAKSRIADICSFIWALDTPYTQLWLLKTGLVGGFDVIGHLHGDAYKTRIPRCVPRSWGALRGLHRRSMRYARREARLARRRTRELSRPDSDWMPAGKRAMCASAKGAGQT